MLAEAGYTPEGEDLDAILKTKRCLGDILKIQGYPAESNTNFKANVNDLVYATIHRILFGFACKTGRKICLQREKLCLQTLRRATQRNLLWWIWFRWERKGGPYALPPALCSLISATTNSSALPVWESIDTISLPL